MPDNTLLNVGTGGDTLATDEIGAIKYQRIKIVEGADGVNDGDISATNPLPVESRGAINRTASGALGALNAAVTINAEGTGAINWEIDTGTLVGTVVFEATLDDATWFAIDAIRINGTVIASTTTFADRGALTSSGYSQARLRVSAFTSGTSNARLEASFGASTVRLGQALPTGTNSIGKIDARVRNAADSTYIEPATDRITAGGPFSARLSDGTAFYDATKTGQLPTALVGGRLDTIIGAALPAGTNNIGDVDVLTLPALPAGTNNIGDVDVITLPALPAGTNNIGDVDVLTLPSIPAGANNIGDVDVLTLPSIPAGTNNIGDVDVLTLPALPTGTNEIGSIRIRGQLDDVATVTPAEDGFESIRITAQRGAHVNLRNNAGTEIGTAGAPVRIDPTGATAQPVTDNAGSLTVDGTVSISGAVDTELPAAVALADNTANPTVPGVGAFLMAFDGTNWDRVQTGAAATGALKVDGSAVTQPVSIAAAIDVSDRAARLVGQVEGRAAHDGALAGNPQRVGVQARAAQQAVVTDLNTVNLQADRHGNLRTRSGVQAPAASIFTNVNFPAVNVRASSTRAAGAAGVRHILTGLTAVLAAGATAPTAVQLDVRVRDGILDTGTILWQSVITLPATAGAMNGIARSGLWIPGTAATAMTIEFSAAGGANTFESVSMEIVDITE